MSVVVKHPGKTDRAICFVKGADSAILPLCRGNNKEVERSIEQMARKGLRTLCYARKEIYWNGTRDATFDLPIEEVESDLTLLAATGVEDLLQEQVKECITDFREAGISVWMLTGDKGLTALEIGVSCGLIPEQSNSNEILMFEDDDTDENLLQQKIFNFSA